MTARIFISYRTSDGRDKATALARELGAVFGDAQVFIDKDDLRGGSAWRAEVAQALDAKPVLLLLLTPQLLSATGPDGTPRIAAADDPVRRELEAALAAGAHVLPLLCDGVDTLPDAALLPPPFSVLGERTWRRLRAYDWQNDVRKLVDDLQALGIAPQPPSRQRRWLLWAAPAGLAATGAGLWFAARQREPGPAAPSTPSMPPTPATLSGDWELSGSGDAPFTLTVQHDGTKIRLQSRPVSVIARPDWDGYRAFWRERFDEALGDIVYRGEGLTDTPPGAATVADIAITLVEAKRESAVDGGNLHVTLSADGQRLTGMLWLNSQQAERPVELRRLR